jgi:hypothetical protein
MKKFLEKTKWLAWFSAGVCFQGLITYLDKILF